MADLITASIAMLGIAVTVLIAVFGALYKKQERLSERMTAIEKDSVSQTYVAEAISNLRELLETKMEYQKEQAQKVQAAADSMRHQNNTILALIRDMQKSLELSKNS